MSWCLVHHGPSVGHVEQHALALHVDAQGLALLLDVGHGGVEDVLPLGDELAACRRTLVPPAVWMSVTTPDALTGESTPPKMTYAPLPTQYVAISSAFSQ